MSANDELTTAVDTLVSNVEALHNGMGDVAAFSHSLSTLLAVVIGKATAMAASAVTGLAKPFFQRMDQNDLRLGRIETQLKANSRFLHEIHTRLDKYASRLDDLERERGDDSG